MNHRMSRIPAPDHVFQRGGCGVAVPWGLRACRDGCAKILLHRVSTKMVWQFRKQHPSKAPSNYIHANLVGPEHATLFRHQLLGHYGDTAVVVLRRQMKLFDKKAATKPLLLGDVCRKTCHDLD